MKLHHNLSSHLRRHWVAVNPYERRRPLCLLALNHYRYCVFDCGHTDDSLLSLFLSFTQVSIYWISSTLTQHILHREVSSRRSNEQIRWTMSWGWFLTYRCPAIMVRKAKRHLDKVEMVLLLISSIRSWSVHVASFYFHSNYTELYINNNHIWKWPSPCIFSA